MPVFWILFESSWAGKPCKRVLFLTFGQTTAISSLQSTLLKPSFSRPQTARQQRRDDVALGGWLGGRVVASQVHLPCFDAGGGGRSYWKPSQPKAQPHMLAGRL